ncbi:DAR GTPase 3, chloroplastic [Capsicum annuum]|uniref:DAR GTPase 3, chloroplastic n=1 Tax=Capsicum annuum TaxID=4072 RepID=A0A2G2ZEN5_CAPAN|nr:DAR GTPase 3, chloroplastic [Capsicum annuum]
MPLAVLNLKRLSATDGYAAPWFVAERRRPYTNRRPAVGWKGAGGSGNENSKLFNACEGIQEEYDWNDLETELYRWTKTLRPVQWYPGHIAKTEKELKEQLKLMDVVIEVRDARIPMSTSHPQMDSWLGNRKRILVLNREDMISTADRNAWASYYANQGIKVVFSNGQLGMGALKLGRLAKALAGTVNVKRKAKGLLPRPVRAGVVGYPNVGKSSLVNRLLKRRMCPAAPRPGVTRELKWVRFGKDLELLDSPGIIPMRISDQTAAIKLAICDDIGERSYDALDVAAILVQMLSRLPTVGNKALCDRYKIEADGCCGKIFVQKLAVQLFNADNNQAAFRILQDFRKGKFGWIALERPPRQLNHSLATIPLAGLGRNIPTLVLYLLYGGAELVMYIVMYISTLQVQ